MHLHGLSPKIVHKDIKSNNLLVGADGTSLQLCDFGDAEVLEGHYLQRCTAATWLYTPPEIFACPDPSKPHQATELVDVWSMGCVILEIAGFQPPFTNLLHNLQERQQLELLRNLYNCQRLEVQIPEGVPPYLKNLVQHCLVFDAASRATSQAVRRNVSYPHRNYVLRFSSTSNVTRRS